jgi:hypothetical protein
VGLADVLVVVSPNVHAEVNDPRPPSSLDAFVKVQLRFVQLNVKLAVGAVLPLLVLDVLEVELVLLVLDVLEVELVLPVLEVELVLDVLEVELVLLVLDVLEVELVLLVLDVLEVELVLLVLEVLEVELVLLVLDVLEVDVVVPLDTSILLVIERVAPSLSVTVSLTK